MIDKSQWWEFGQDTSGEGNKNARVYVCMFSFHLLVFDIISNCTNKIGLITH